MRLNEVFPSKYMKASDVKTPAVLTVARVDVETVGTGADADDKPVLRWAEGGYKPLIGNMTNCLAIADIAGTDELGDWPGARVEAYATRVQFGRKMVDAVRLRRPREEGGHPVAKQETPPRPRSAMDTANAELASQETDDTPF